MALKSKTERTQRMQQAAYNREQFETVYRRPYDPHSPNYPNSARGYPSPEGSHNFKDKRYTNAYSCAYRYVKQIAYLNEHIPMYQPGPLKDEQLAMLAQRKQSLKDALALMKALYQPSIYTEFYTKAKELL